MARLVSTTSPAVLCQDEIGSCFSSSVRTFGLLSREYEPPQPRCPAGGRISFWWPDGHGKPENRRVRRSSGFRRSLGEVTMNPSFFGKRSQLEATALYRKESRK